MHNIPKIHIYSIISLLILSFALTCYFRKSTTSTVMIDGDGSGHYAWLPSIFIYKTLDFKEVFESEKLRKGPDYQGHNYHDVNGIIVNKFPPGTAIMIMPFFIIALIISSLSTLPADGYNIIFQYSVGIAALFWTIIGLVFAYRLLIIYKITHKNSLLIVMASFFGTNLFAYTFLMPAFSHVYSFTLISILLYHTRLYFLNNKLGNLIVSSIILGLIFTVRPANILVVLFLPFLASTSSNFINSIKQLFKEFKLIYAVLAFFIALLPYLTINYIQTGTLYYDAYTNEGFHWTDPQILNFLFSFRKGWFIYTPFLLLIFPSLWTIYRKNKYEFLWIIIFLVILIYVFSSWWNWFYGDSFGMRPMLDFTGIYILVIALYYRNIGDIIKSITLIFIFLTIALNIIQTYQYSKGIIHPDSMNRKAYFSVFLKTDTKYSGIISSGPEYYYGRFNNNPLLEELNDFEKDYNNWAPVLNPETKVVYSGNKSVRLTSKSVYSPSFKIKLSNSLQNRNNLYVGIEAMIYEPQKNAAKNALFILDIQNKQGKTVFYKKARLKQIPDNITNQWIKVETGYKLPLLTNEYQLINVYIWNVEKSEFFIDDLKVELFDYHN